jgi:hypothetical protein
MLRVPLLTSIAAAAAALRIVLLTTITAATATVV